MTHAAFADVQSVPASSLGGPGPAESVRCAACAIAALSGLAGPGLRMTSLALELTAHDMGEGAVELRTHGDKRTRSILFASVEARVGGQLVFTAQALFSARKEMP